MDVDDLEGAINSAKKEVGSEKSEVESGDAKGSGVSREEEAGFHKGALNVLVAERNELVKMLGNVEAIAGAHVKRLKELGVDVGGKE